MQSRHTAQVSDHRHVDLDIHTLEPQPSDISVAAILDTHLAV